MLTKLGARIFLSVSLLSLFILVILLSVSDSREVPF